MGKMKDNVKKTADEVRHIIKCRLFPNNIGRGGPYIARVVNNRTLQLNDVCDSMITRGKYSGEAAPLRLMANALVEEAMYLAADGFAVCLGPLTISPKVTGTFLGASTPWNRTTNPVKIKTRTTAEARRIEKLIGVEIDPNSGGKAAIETFTDDPLRAVNSRCRAGDYFTIKGSMIRIEGSDPSVGLWFVPEENPAAAVRVDNLALNKPSRLIGVCPDTSYRFNKLRVVTQYGGHGDILREPRVIEPVFTLESV